MDDGDDGGGGLAVGGPHALAAGERDLGHAVILRGDLAGDQFGRQLLRLIELDGRRERVDLAGQPPDFVVVAVDQAADELRLGHHLVLEGGVLMDDDLGARDADFLRIQVEPLAGGGFQLLAGQIQLNGGGLALDVGVIVIDEALAQVLVLLDEEPGVAGEVVVLDHLDGGEHAWDQQDEEDHGDPARIALPLPLIVGHGGEVQQVAYRHEGRQGDEYGVDDEKVEGADDEVPVQVRDAVAHRTQRRHEGGGDGHARNHGAALLFAGVLQDAGETAEQGDEYVVEGRVGARQQLGLVLQLQRREQVEERRSEDADHHHDGKILQGVLDQRGVSVFRCIKPFQELFLPLPSIIDLIFELRSWQSIRVLRSRCTL